MFHLREYIQESITLVVSKAKTKQTQTKLPSLNIKQKLQNCSPTLYLTQNQEKSDKENDIRTHFQQL